MRVLVCGSRTFTDAQFVWNVLTGMKKGSGIETLIEGQCPYGGADLFAERWAKANFVDHLPFTPEIVDGRVQGPKRNQRMLDEGKPDLVLAFIDKPLDQSRGTRDMVTRARAAGVKTIVIEVV